MTEKEYLSIELKKLAEQFKNVQIKYAYNNDIFTHIIELTPLEEYYKNEKLDNAWIPISLNFQNNYPNGEICFISSDSSLAVKNPELEFNTLREYIIDPFQLFNSILNTKICSLAFDQKIAFSLEKSLIHSHQQLDKFSIYFKKALSSSIKVDNNKGCFVKLKETSTETQSLAA